jgi:hypothetical protein
VSPQPPKRAAAAPRSSPAVPARRATAPRVTACPPTHPPTQSPAHLCAVDVLEAAQHLVEEELVVLRGQVVVGLDDLAHSRHSMDT